MLDGVAVPETDGPGGRFMSLVYCHEYQASVLAINAARLDSITFTPGMVFPPWETPFDLPDPFSRSLVWYAIIILILCQKISSLKLKVI